MEALMLTYRILFIGALLLICFGVAFWGFLEYEQHQFEKNLSTPEAEQQTAEGEVLKPEPQQDEKRETEPQIPAAAEMPSLSIQDIIAEGEKLANEAGIEGFDPDEITSEEHTFNWLTDGMGSEPPKAVWQDLNTGVDVDSLSPEEFEVHYANQLRKKHGVLPEIDVYVRLYRRIIHTPEPGTLDEHIRLIELMNFFYPEDNDLSRLQTLKDLRDQFGGDVVMSPVPPEGMELLKQQLLAEEEEE